MGPTRNQSPDAWPTPSSVRCEARWLRSWGDRGGICRKIDLCKSRGAEPVGKRAPATSPGQKPVGISTCANRRDRIYRIADLCAASRAKTCRNIDLCKSPRRNLSENRPVQAFQLHKSHYRQTFFPPGLRDGSAIAQATIPSGGAAIANEADISNKQTTPIVYEAS